MITRVGRLMIKYQEFFLYAFWGGCTTVINIGIFEVLVESFRVYYQTANVFAWIISVSFAYLTNRVWVFKSHYIDNQQLFKEAIRFYTSRLASLGVELIIVYVGIKVLQINTLFVKIIDNLIVIILNYALSKLLIFKKRH